MFDAQLAAGLIDASTAFIDEQGFEPADVEESEEEDVKPAPAPRITTRNAGRKVSQRQVKESSPETSQESSASRTSVKRTRVSHLLVPRFGTF